MNVLRGGGDWLDRTLRIPRRPPGLAPPPDEVPAPQIIGRPSKLEPLLERAGQRAAEVERQAAQDIERFASQQVAEAEATEGFASAAEVAAAGAETAAAVETGGALTALGEGALPGGGRHCGRCDRGTGGRGGRGGRGRHGLGHLESQRCLAHARLGRRDGRRHGQRRLAALPSHGRPNAEWHARVRAIDHFFAQQLRPTGSTRIPRASRKPSLGNRFEPAPSGGRARAGSSPRPSAATRSPSR